ncbi:hypothetical protein U1Q18_007428, partial [Sarracenia purpurea var. burkii]
MRGYVWDWPRSPRSPIKSLQEVGLAIDTNRFKRLIENPEITDLGLVTPSAATYSDAVPPDNASFSVLTSNLANPVSNEVLIMTDLADQVASSVENLASVQTDMDSLEDRGAPKGATPPVQPLLMQTNKKSSSGKKNRH